MFSMSPRQQVVASTRNIGGGWGIQGYDIPVIQPIDNGKAFCVPKLKRQSIIEEQANKKKLIPSPSSYKLKPSILWGEGNSLNRSPSNLPKEDRISEFE